MRITLDVKPEPKRYNVSIDVDVNVDERGDRSDQHPGSVANRQSADLWHLVSQLRISALVDDDSTRSDRSMDKQRTNSSHRHL